MFYGSCSNLNQLNKLRKVNISNNYFSVEASFVPKDTWQYESHNFYFIKLKLFYRQINAFNSFTKITESIDFKLLQLNHFFAETIELPIKQLSVLESMDLNFETCTPIANGCSGVVCKIKVDVDESKKKNLH